MGGLKDFWNAKNEWHEQIWEGLKDDPWRIFTGFDPLSTEISNGILGRDDEPLGDWFGGPTSEQLASGRYSPGEIDSAKTGKVVIPLMVGGIMGGTALAGGASGGGGGAGAAAGGGGGWGAGGGAGAAGGGGGWGGGGGATAGGGGFDFGSLFNFGGGEGGFGAMDWSSPGTYMDLMGMMPGGGMPGQGGQQQTAAGPRPIHGPGQGVSDMYGLPPVASPPRVMPFGLLETPEDEEMMKAMLAGIL